MIPTYELTGESFNISDKGTVFTARLTSDSIKEELLASQLLGTLVNGEIIIGIESYLISDKELKTGDLINLLVQKENKNG